MSDAGREFDRLIRERAGRPPPEPERADSERESERDGGFDRMIREAARVPSPAPEPEPPRHVSFDGGPRGVIDPAPANSMDDWVREAGRALLTRTHTTAG